MKRLLAARNQGVLVRVARARALLAFDFDGTLAPIVARRGRARMRERTRRLLAALCTLYPCAVISGRSRADVARRLGGASVAHVVGNHGIEPGGHLRGLAREMANVRPALHRALRRVGGVEIEDKRYSLSIHYRAAKRRGAARRAIERAAAALRGRVRTVPGKLVVNVVPRDAPDKGAALRALCRRSRAGMALYLGDDVTDEDAFGARLGIPAVTVRVGRSRRSRARYWLATQREVDAMLARLIRERRKARLGGGERPRSPGK